MGRTSDLEGDVEYDGLVVQSGKPLVSVGVVLESVCLTYERVESSRETKIIRLNGASLHLAIYQTLITCFGDQTS